MAQAAHHHDGYYVPHGSAWPIKGPIGLFVMMLGAGSMLNGAAWGQWALLAGVAIILYMVFGWFGTVIAESEQGMYNALYFVNDCAGLLDVVKKCGADVIGIDWRVDMARAARKLGKKYSLQGNLDPLVLFAAKEHIADRVKDILFKAEPARGHIFNLGHGILPETPVENAIAMVEAVHTYGRND